MHDFPVYDEPRFGPLLDAFLKGEVRIEGDRTPEVVATLFAANRAATAPQLRAERDAGRTLVCDRYHLSNAAYQGARLPDPSRLDAFLDWILGVELDVMGALRPDVSLWLRVPLDMRPHRARPGDVYERDLALQQRVHDTYERLAELGHVVAVDGVRDGQLLAPAEIARALRDAAGS